MRPFEYASPTTSKQVPELLGQNWGEVEVLAGGTDLLSLMKDDITTPKRLVNIKNVAGLHGVRAVPDALIIGALTTLDEIAANPQVRRECSEAAGCTRGGAGAPGSQIVAKLGGICPLAPRRGRSFWQPG